MKLLLVAASLIGGSLAANAGQAAITSGPNDLTINAGSTADFIVTATNATRYQWSFEGTNIIGATNAELNFSDVSTNQAGDYSVIVGGSSGSDVTNSANLTVLQGTIVNFQISGFASGPSNILVELFDHDKPATVQNFLHYIISDSYTYANGFVPGGYTNTYSSGVYTNMFFDRLIPGFVLQGGGWFAYDRTNSTNKLFVDNIETAYSGLNFSPPFPQQVDSEFYVGPKVSNTKGTIAMALPAGDVNGATDAFYFNLADNTNLDTVNSGGPYTVFGRVLNGTNVLEYFNNPKAFSKPAFTRVPTHNIFTNGIFDYVLLNPTDTTELTDLPVNYHGTNLPADSNLFFVDFSFPATNAQPVIDTTPPTAAITFPPANIILTNGISLTVRGTAQDDVGLARVFCSLADQQGSGGANAIGTTNWSVFFGLIPPGVYRIIVAPQDGAGNLDPNQIIQTMIVSAVLTNGVGSVSVTNVANGAYAGDAVGANLLVKTNYAFGAQPGPGQFFVNWTYGTNVSFNPNLTVRFASNMVLTANFLSNSVPGGIAFTNPPVGGNTTNGTFPIAGVITSGLFTPPVTVTCRLFSATNQQLIGAVRQIKATNHWSFPLTNLALGSYYAVVAAQDALGQGAVITNDFTAGLPMTALTNTNANGRGTFTPNYNGHFLVEGQRYSMTATAAAGSLFDTWSDGVNYTNNRVVSFKMRPGLVLTATFVSNDFPATVLSPITITNPAPGAKLTNQTFNLSGTINPALTNPVVSYQLFYGSNSVTAPSATNVTIIPGAAPARTTWTAGLTNVAPGYYTVVATVTDVKGRSTLISESFQVLAQVLLQSNPGGYGRVFSNWTTGHFVSVGVPHAVAAGTNGGYVFAFWSNSATGGSSANNPLAFVATTNMTLTANFASNYFFNVAGTYNGLFSPSDTNTFISPTNSGYYTLMVTSNGAINVKLCFPGLTNTATGQFPLYDPAGYASAGFFWKGLDGKYVTNYVELDLTGGSYSLIGEVTNAEFSSSLQAFRAATNLTGSSAVIPGTNVFFITGDHGATNNHPGGDGYASLTLGANGAINLIGHLAANSSFSQNTAVAASGTNAAWPFYASLYGGKGIILGWETNSSPTNFAGEVVWSKPAIPAKAGVFYTNAFLWLTNSYSFGCIPPVAGTHYQIAFGGATLTNRLTNTLTVGTNGQFTVDASQTNQLTLMFIPKSGVLTGSFSYPSSKSNHALSGAFISPALGGSGYFLDTNNSETGFFEIGIVP